MVMSVFETSEGGLSPPSLMPFPPLNYTHLSKVLFHLSSRDSDAVISELSRPSMNVNGMVI
jgi:hypothetical protein